MISNLSKTKIVRVPTSKGTAQEFDDKFYLSVSAVGNGVVAEVELHVVEIN